MRNEALGKKAQYLAEFLAELDTRANYTIPGCLEDIREGETGVVVDRVMARKWAEEIATYLSRRRYKWSDHRGHRIS